ncbi:hypothetical protein [Mesorhizobium sp. B2-3-4]|uniref:hypothetical protein n=1 Tax=Mesorhizobium sp. B2-3-4 TaxID=2589959 RepID=UPI0011294EC0|nr:hypothetical protein [Mesorhizobium sp. B2-3-4]TPM39629.1 hypothetical protein FJ967_09110 [Mesorhizobium sp. B2-3-4]
MTIERIIEKLRAGLEQLKDWPDHKRAANFRAIPKFTIGDLRALLSEIESSAQRMEAMNHCLIEAMETSPVGETAEQFVERLTGIMEMAADKLDLAASRAPTSQKDGGDHG